MNNKITVGLVPIARPTFDVPFAEQIMTRARERLQTAGFELIGPAALVMSIDTLETCVESLQNSPLDLLIVLQASFADSTMALYLAQHIDAPLVLWAVPEAHSGERLRLNSFCGINLAGHGLTRAGYRYEYLYADPDSDESLNKINIIAKAAAVKRRLASTRIGRIGENPAGFDTCLVNHTGLKTVLGLEVEQIALSDFFQKARDANPNQVETITQRVKARVAEIDTLDATATTGTFSTYVALNALAHKQQLAGLAVRCWPEFFTDLGCSACGAMSLLSDEMLPCSCEADVNGTITQVILQWISEEAAFGSDIVSFDTTQNIAILWHCGLAPLSMADPDVQPRGTIHSNRKMPLLMEFPLKPGRVTLARLSEATGSYRLVIGTGEMLKAPPSFTGTTGTLRFDSGAQAVMDTLMYEGLEHHLSLTYGDHTETLLVLARLLNLPVLRL